MHPDHVVSRLPPGRAAHAAPRTARSDRGTLVAVTGASGGLGASVVTAALGVRAAAAGRSVCAVDLDVLGGGLDVVLGLEQTPGTRWADLTDLDGDGVGPAILVTLPSSDGVPVLSHDRSALPVGVDVVSSVVSALMFACDLVVLDLPSPGHPPQGCPRADAHIVLSGTGLSHVAALSAILSVLARDSDRPGSPGRVETSAGTGRPDGSGGSGVVGGSFDVADDDPRWSATSTPVSSRHAGPAPVPGVLVRTGAGGGAAARAEAVADVVRRRLGATVIGVLPDDRTLEGDLAHGFAPGGRRGPLATTAEQLLAAVLPPRRGGAA